MEGPRAVRLIAAALRCYPSRWRRRHGDEAAELAALLLRNGTPAGSIAWSYLAGAAREWLTPPPGRPLSAAACALLVAACALGVSAGVLASTVPAKAASTRQALRPAPCPPGPLDSIPGMIPAMDHPQLIIWEAVHDRSC